jgi:hypothetical protein
VSEKSLEMRHFQAFAHLEEPRVAPFRAAEVAQDARNGKNGPMEPVWSTISAGQKAKKEILARFARGD